jgi:hypothetical protein
VLTPRFKSEARIVHDGRENVFPHPGADKAIDQDRGSADAETLTDQMQIVLSHPIALEVIGELKPYELPEFDPVLRGISTLRHFMQLAGNSRDLLAMTPERRVLESLYEAHRLFAGQVPRHRGRVPVGRSDARGGDRQCGRRRLSAAATSGPAEPATPVSGWRTRSRSCAPRLN